MAKILTYIPLTVYGFETAWTEHCLLKNITNPGFPLMFYTVKNREIVDHHSYSGVYDLLAGSTFTGAFEQLDPSSHTVGPFLIYKNKNNPKTLTLAKFSSDHKRRLLMNMDIGERMDIFSTPMTYNEMMAVIDLME